MYAKICYQSLFWGQVEQELQDHFNLLDIDICSQACTGVELVFEAWQYQRRRTPPVGVVALKMTEGVLITLCI
jgi:hypothetical protein